MLDLLIRGGTVVDGTGRNRRRVDIGVRAGRVVTDLDGQTARRTVDADGLVVAPGFVDLHTHYDAQLFWDPTASPSTLHGVTTVLGGNCGFTLAPAGPEHADYLMRMMARVEGMPLAALESGLPWDWTSYDDWISRLDGKVGVNAGFLVGHSAIRRAVMGDASHEPATQAQVDQMVALLHECLTAGGLGFSSSQAHTHNDGEGLPVPSRAASADELLALARAVRDHEGTTLEFITAGCINGFTDDEMNLMADMSLQANRPLNWNVLGVSALSKQHEHQLSASDVAAERGARVVALTLPHLMSIRLSFLTGVVLEALPGWKDVLSLPVPERIQALRDPGVRERMRAGADSDEAGMLRGLANWHRLNIAETFAPENEGLAGRSVGSIAKQRGADAFDVLLDVVTADELRTGLQPPMMGNDDDDWKLRAEVWRDPRTVIGGSDAGAHLDMMCGATYSTSLLSNAVRERGLLSLEEAVHELTDVPARLYGIRDRGRIADGWYADLILFDPDTIGHGPERTRYDLPSGAPRLFAEASGVHRVFVNGAEVVSEGVATGAVPGTVLRSGRDTETVTVVGGGE
ncbi:MAG: amidohydrolase family protein [Actinomycetes bacterium]